MSHTGTETHHSKVTCPCPPTHAHPQEWCIQYAISIILNQCIRLRHYWGSEQRQALGYARQPRPVTLPSHYTHTTVVDCGAPDEPASNGAVSVGPTTFRETADYSCRPGYDLVGPETVVCQADGTWSERPPNCIRK